MTHSILEQKCGIKSKIISSKDNCHFPEFYLISHNSISPVSHLYQTNKDKNEIITLGCSGGEQAEHHHDKYSCVQNL